MARRGVAWPSEVPPGRRNLLELGHEVDLPGDFAEAERAVEVVADVVLHQRFDLGVREARAAEVGQGVRDELPTKALPAKAGCDGQVRNVADARLAILPGRDIADDLPLVLGDEDALR